MSKLTGVTGVFALNSVPMIDPTKLKVIAGYNVREDFDPDMIPADLELLNSIRENGFQSDKPVTIRIVGKDAYVIAGHRRLAACLQLIDEGVKLPGMAIIPEGRGAGQAERSLPEMTLDLMLSNSGKPLEPSERGAAIERLVSYGMSPAEIAQKSGITVKWVGELRKLAKLDKRLRLLIKAGVVAPTLAVETAAKHGKNAAPIIEEAAKRGTGANAGKATGKTVAKVTGVPAKNAKATPRDTLQQNAAQHAELAAKMAAAPKAGTSSKGSALPHRALTGPFTVGTDIDDCMIYEGNGTELAEFASSEKARAVLTLLNQAWPTFAGKATTVEAEPAAPVKGKAVKAIAAPVAPIEAVIAAKANGAARPSTVRTSRGK